MIGKVALCAAWLAACSYSDPSLGTTEFRCTKDEECLEGQHCAGTVCVVATHDGVACGTERCAPDRSCCLDGVNDPRCIPAQDACLGTIARCDGIEDCGPGLQCCEAGTQVICLEACAVPACQAADDCPSEAPNCCDDDTAEKTWKVCQLAPC